VKSILSDYLIKLKKSAEIGKTNPEVVDFP